MRAFVHEPMKIRSSSMSLIGAARLERHVCQRALRGLAARRLGETRRVGHAL